MVSNARQIKLLRKVLRSDCGLIRRYVKDKKTSETKQVAYQQLIAMPILALATKRKY